MHSAQVTTPAPTTAPATTSAPASAPAAWGTIVLPESKLFGTDGIRGQAGELLTAPLALQVGYWAGQVLRQSDPQLTTIVLGRDSRNSGTMLGNALSAGLTAAGLDVWDLGMCPTPAVSTLTHQSGAIGGVMISASHNPPQDNGIKFFGADGCKLDPQLQQQIEAALRGQRHDVAVSQWGQHHPRPELIEQYIQTVQAPLLVSGDRPLAGLRIVLDLAWGAATRTAVTVFERLGAEVIALHATPDGDRINVNCGSTHLELLQNAVKATQANFGFAFDGDADRVLAVDGNGRTVDGDYILYLWGKQLLAQGKLPGKTIVSTVMSNLGFERAWEQQGGTLVRAAVGDQYVQAEMVKLGAALGGEQSGHILCPHFGVSGDGVMTALHLANLIQQAGGNLAALIDDSFQTYPQILKNVRVENRDRRLNWQSCAPLQQAIAAATAAMGDRGRVLVRASGTEPLIRVMVEAETAELVNTWTSQLVDVVEKYLV
jgi:phosphoglucosamine mutase